MKNFIILTAAVMLLDHLIAKGLRAWPLYRRHFYLFVMTGLIPLIPVALGWGERAIASALGLALSSVTIIKSRFWSSHSWSKAGQITRDPSRPLVVVADPHWNDHLQGLRELHEKNPNCDWLFLGDVFELWIGLPSYETPVQKEFMLWVDQERGKGSWIGLWLGNREYFLDYHASRFDLIGEGIGGELKGESLRFEHGDLINHNDWKYRIWNLLTRSSFAWVLFRCLPSSVGIRISSYLANRLKTTNINYKLHFPEKVFQSVVEAFPKETFIVGHFHIYQHINNGYVIPWAHHGAHACWANHQIRIISSDII